MKLFVANCSKQNFEFAYWAPENRRPLVQRIGIGEQVQVYKDANPEDLRNIIEQHLPYGIVKTDEIDRTKAFVGLAYQFDKPINVEKIMIASENNDDVLTKMALERRKEGAAALDNTLSSIAQDAGNGLASLSMEVEEVPRPGIDTAVNETIEVQKEGSRRGRPRRGN